MEGFKSLPKMKTGGAVRTTGGSDVRKDGGRKTGGADIKTGKMTGGADISTGKKTGRSDVAKDGGVTRGLSDAFKRGGKVKKMAFGGATTPDQAAAGLANRPAMPSTGLTRAAEVSGRAMPTTGSGRLVTPTVGVKRGGKISKGCK